MRMDGWTFQRAQFFFKVILLRGAGSQRPRYTPTTRAFRVLRPWLACLSARARERKRRRLAVVPIHRKREHNAAHRSALGRSGAAGARLGSRRCLPRPARVGRARRGRRRGAARAGAAAAPRTQPRALVACSAAAAPSCSSHAAPAGGRARASRWWTRCALRGGCVCGCRAREHTCARLTHAQRNASAAPPPPPDTAVGPQVTVETLKVPDRDAERELVDAVNDATPECVAAAAAARAARLRRARVAVADDGSRSPAAPTRARAPRPARRAGCCARWCAASASRWSSPTRTCSCWRFRRAHDAQTHPSCGRV
jgi:hypothetical protein